MGFSVSAGTAIILVAAFASVGMLYTTAYNGYEQVQDASDIEQETDLTALNTEIAITNISRNSTKNPDLVTVTAQNEGTNTLSVADTDLLVNGTYKSNVSYRITTNGQTLSAGDSGTDLWQPRESLTITLRENVSAPLGVKLVSETGVSTAEVGS
ncbi:fla cluster protein FlaF [Halodesulfurarchaeum sp.]|uniref:fla cluster protein FlaF n=1 Tax=Halodesulfurarchaeum sp. TaxID=1980530 RepID=UPI001BC7A938|nr:fla cluster protein FlaF [Halodesulfurarchaeum sp.]